VLLPKKFSIAQFFVILNEYGGPHMYRNVTQGAGCDSV